VKEVCLELLCSNDIVFPKIFLHNERRVDCDSRNLQTVQDSEEKVPELLKHIFISC